MKSIWRILLVGLVALAVPALSPIPASAGMFTVNSAADTADANVGDGNCDAGAGVCTLRAAIQEANANSDPSTISFGELTPNTIQPALALPNIIRPVIITGTEPDGDRIELDGTNAGVGANGLTLSSADTSTIRGFVINRFSADGIALGSTATENLVENNYIGTDVAGTMDLGNGSNGLDIVGHTNTVGGSTASSRNVISGNQGSGVAIRGGASENVVEGNFIGTDLTGTAALPNNTHGVVLDSLAHDNFIGSTAAGGRNIISGNAQDGVRVQASGTTANVVQGNFIGTALNGTDPLPNSQDGVGIRLSASENTVGGTAAGAGNVISGNTDDGIQVGTPTDSTPNMNALLRNSIFGNGTLGIDLEPLNGLTANDPGDGDPGTNNLQNFPVLTSAASSATTTTISGTLNSEASKTYRLEFFSNDACDSSGNGEGQRFLGATNVTTDSSGNVNFTASSLTGGVAGQMATATATDPDNNTSEFSACTPVAVDTTPPVTGPPAPPPPPPAPPVRCPGFQSDSRAQFVGSAGNDVLEGTSGRDIICGLGGNDTIRGLGRGDVLIGGAGSDVLIGGRGNDIVRGGRGRDIVRGGRGRDIVRGGRGRDTLLGGRSADTLLGGRGNDVLRGGPGRDVLDGGRGRDRCRGGRGNDVLRRCER